MRRWFFSLWFRLIVGFALILAIALGSVSFYIANAAEREAGNFERLQERVRQDRIQRLVSRTYADELRTSTHTGVLAGEQRIGPVPGENGNGPEGRELQRVLERSAPLVGQRIVVRDSEGNIVGDSHRRHGPPWRRWNRGDRHSAIVMDGRQVGSVEVGPNIPGNTPDEPSVSNLVSSINNYLIWTGLVAGLGGVLLVSLVSRQILSPVQALGAVASRLGRGDLSHRADSSGPTEIRELADSFNRMAVSLGESEAQRQNLVADVAHELRTPLFNIQGYLEAIKDGLLEPDSDTIDTIHVQVIHLGRLVEDLRLLAQAEAGALHLDLATDSLDDVVAGAVDAARARAEAGGVSLHYMALEGQALALGTDPVRRSQSGTVAWGGVLCVMDRTRIAQVVSNLLDNAVQHTPPGGSVTVGMGLTAPGTVRVSVADDGEGIPAEYLPLIFERFYRVDPSRSRATGGAGLGLTIARRLVEAHGGTIWAESPEYGGTTVSFELPVAGDGFAGA